MNDRSTTLDPLLYYRLQVVTLQLQLFDAQIAPRRQILVEAVHAVMREAGLDPAATYTLIDAGTQAVRQEPPS